jgi:hypothetical protein
MWSWNRLIKKSTLGFIWGINFFEIDNYPGFKQKITPPKHFRRQCIWSDKNVWKCRGPWNDWYSARNFINWFLIMDQSNPIDANLEMFCYNWHNCAFVMFQFKVLLGNIQAKNYFTWVIQFSVYFKIQPWSKCFCDFLILVNKFLDNWTTTI